MITKRINIKPHLVEYLVAKYNNYDFDTPIRFPDKLDLYHTIYNLLERRPVNAKEIDGNLWFSLPVVRNGKNPEQFNYLGKRAIGIIHNKIETGFWAELHEYLMDEKHNKGTQYIDAVFQFMKTYGITMITEDALLKNYKRWRDKCRKRKPRKYVKNTEKMTEQVV